MGLGNHLTICLKTDENQENLRRDGRPQDIPQASSSLLLAFASMVILGVEPHRDP
jgi:hypothetical protein